MAVPGMAVPGMAVCETVSMAVGAREDCMLVPASLPTARLLSSSRVASDGSVDHMMPSWLEGGESLADL